MARALRRELAEAGSIAASYLDRFLTDIAAASSFLICRILPSSHCHLRVAGTPGRYVRMCDLACLVPALVTT